MDLKFLHRKYLETMIDSLKEYLVRISKNLIILREREAKFGGNAPIELINQINDHEKAESLIQQTIKGELSEKVLKEALKPLLLEPINQNFVDFHKIAQYQDKQKQRETLQYVLGDIASEIQDMLAFTDSCESKETLREKIRDLHKRLEVILPLFQNNVKIRKALMRLGQLIGIMEWIKQRQKTHDTDRAFKIFSDAIQALEEELINLEMVLSQQPE